MGEGNMRTDCTSDSIYNHILGGQFTKVKHALKCAIAFVIIIVICFCPAGVVSATTPSTFTIVSAQACRSLIENDDFLLVVYYDINYTVGQPPQSAAEYFHFKLLSTDGETLISTAKPYPYQNNGYDRGIVSFYFPADDAPTWGDPYVIKIGENPLYYSGEITPTTYTLNSSDYSAFTDQDDNRTLLGEYLIYLASDLEVNWGFEMLTEGSSGVVLNTTGESYFTGSITGIKFMCPDILLTFSGKPDYTPDDWDTYQADEYANRYDGTWFGDTLDGLGDFLGVPGQIATSMIMLIIIAVLFAFSQRIVHTTTPALIASGNVLICSFIMGFVSASIMAITVFVFVLFIGYILVFRNG